VKPGLTMNYRAQGAIAPHRIVAAGSEDQTVKQAGAGTDALVGVTPDVGAADGQRVDAIHGGIAGVEYGALVEYGDRLTSNADGKAIPATAGDRVVGTAMVSGINGDLGIVLIGHGAAA